jgi:hypothetical protein
MESIAMKRIITTLALLFGLAAAPAFAQQGHPLTGTWQGEWGTNGGPGNFLTLIMEWDGKTVTGLANPGPDSTRIESLTLDSSDWSVTMDMPLKDAKSQTLRFKAEGTISDIGSQTRALKGTWTDGKNSGTFELTRQSGT